MKLKRFLIIFLSIFLSIFLISCNGEDDNDEDLDIDVYNFVEKDMTERKHKVILFSTSPSEDDPWDENFPKDKMKWKAELQKIINELQEKHDANFEVRKYPGGDIEEGIKTYVGGTGNPAAIARVNTNQIFINLVKNGFLPGINDIIKLTDDGKIITGDNYTLYKDTINAVNQLEVATLSLPDKNDGKTYSKTYGISRFNDIPMFNLFLYNSTLTAKAQLGDPLELWEKGEWTWSKMEEFKIKLKDYMQKDDKYTTPLKTFDLGARPYAFSFQFWLFDLYAQRTGKVLTLENLMNEDTREYIDEWKDLYYAEENQPSRTREMTGKDDGEGEIKYVGKWDRYFPNNWSPNQHEAARCFNQGRNAFTNAEVWTYRDYILAPYGSEHHNASRDFKIKILPFPTDVKVNPADNKTSKIMSLAGDMLVVTNGVDKDVTTKFLLDLNKAWVDHNLDEEIEEAKMMKEYSGKTDEELKEIAKSGEIRAKIWVGRHLLNNGNITPAEFDLCVKAYQYYSDPNKITENKLDKLGLMLPILHAVHRYAIDNLDLNSELENAVNQAEEDLKIILEDIKK